MGVRIQRAELKRAWPSRTFAKQVDKMSDAQVIAALARLYSELKD